MWAYRQRSQQFEITPGGWRGCWWYGVWSWDTAIDSNDSNGRLTWHSFLSTQVNKCDYHFTHSSVLYFFVISRVFPLTSRWGSSVQHSHREHTGCRAARGGVFQDEKCKDPTQQALWNLCSFVLWFDPNHSHKYLDSSLTCCPFFPPPDVPGYSAGAGALHPGQQLRRGARLDRHPDQSQPVQPQTPKHLPSFSLPQRPLALLQVLSGHSPWVYALHWVCNAVKIHPASGSFYLFPLSHSPLCIYFQRPAGKHPAGRRWRQRDWEDLFPVQHIHDQTDQDARSDTDKSVCEHACVWPHVLHVYLCCPIVPFVLSLTLLPALPCRGLWQ